MDRPDVIAVRTEVVVRLIVDELFTHAQQLAAEPLDPPDDVLLARAGETLETPLTDPALPARLARLGHATRMAERARFPVACEPCPWLEEQVRERRAEGAEAPALTCLALARREPLDRPRPDDPDAVTWRIPGPGGHVRHLLAVRALELVGAEEMVLKPVWVFGLLAASLDDRWRLAG